MPIYIYELWNLKAKYMRSNRDASVETASRPQRVHTIFFCNYVYLLVIPQFLDFVDEKGC